MTCTKCNKEFIGGDNCPHCGANNAHERQKKRAVAVRLGTKGAATKCLSTRASIITFVVNIVLAALCLGISVLLVNLFAVGEWGNVDSNLSWLNALALLLLVPVIYLLVSSILSAVAAYKMWHDPDGHNSALASSSCTYLVSLKLIVAILFIISTFLSLGLSLVLMTSSAGAMNDINSMDDIVLIVDAEDPKKDVTFGEYIDNAIATGSTYYVAIDDALELLTDTAAMSQLQSSNILQGSDLTNRNKQITYYSAQARKLSNLASIPADTEMYANGSLTTFGSYMQSLTVGGISYVSAYEDTFEQLCKTIARGGNIGENAKQCVIGATHRADLTLIISVSETEIVCKTYIDYVLDSIASGTEYMVAIDEANEILSDNSNLKLFDEQNSPDPEKTLEINETITACSSAAKEALSAISYTPAGMTSANLWLGSMLDFFGVGTHRDVNRFAATEGNALISWLIAILLPIACGATFYLLPLALKRAVVYYEQLHRAKNEGLYDGNAFPTCIYLFVFGGLFVLLGIGAFALTASFDLIGSVGAVATVATSAIGHVSVCLLLVVIGISFILNGLHYLISHKTITAAISSAEAGFVNSPAIPELVELTDNDGN